MPKTVLIVVIAFFFNIYSQNIFANDHEAPKQEGHGEEKKEAEGEHGKEKAEKSGNLPEWVEIQSRLSAIDTKIFQKNEQIKKLIEEKNHLPPSSPKLKGIIDELVAEHKELIKLKEDFEKQNTIFKYRFPEKGNKKDRKYEHGDVKSLEKMEEELSIEGRLNRNQKLIRSQYRDLKTDSKETDSDAHLKSQEQMDESKKSIEEQGPILIKK